MKKVLTLLLISFLLFIEACGGQSAVSEHIFAEGVVSENPSVQSEPFFTFYHSVLNPDNDTFLNSSPLDKQFSPDLSAALNSSEEGNVIQNYINLWGSELNFAQENLKALLDESENVREDAISAFEESQTAWENELDKDLTSFSETYLSTYGRGSDISIYTGYLMLEKVRARALELIDQVLFFGGQFAFSQTEK